MRPPIGKITQSGQNMNYTEAWQREEHAEQFGKAIGLNNAVSLLSGLRPKIEARCLKYVVNLAGGTRASLLDIGCGAGDFYAYLRSLPGFGEVKYEGVNISRPAIEAANRYYKTGVFTMMNGDEDLRGKHADVVLSVDVIPHQVHLFAHLQQILQCSDKVLVVALRTRDVGETILDPELSCQRNYGEWVPWIVVNTSES